MTMKKVAYFSNTDFSLYRFRKELMLAMKEKGFQVFAVATKTEENIVRQIKAEGIKFVDMPLKRGVDFWGGDIVYFFRVFSLCRREKFSLCHNFTIKPCIFAGLAEKWAGIKNIYCTVTGLGYAFERKNILNKLAVFLYRFAFRFVSLVFFLNLDDLNFFLNFNIVKKEKTKLIRGEGVNPQDFNMKNLDLEAMGKIEELFPSENLIVTLAARMLWQKGIKVFKEAADILKEEYPKVEFLLVGSIDKENPSGIEKETIDKWKALRYLGKRADIREILAASDIVVLPSVSREGIPRVLLEAGALAKPLITTDVAGCNVVVKNNENGFLVKPGNSDDLAEKIRILIKNDDLRKKFGKKSREIVEENFDVNKIVENIIANYNIS